MANATPSPVTTQIRKIIFENFNDVDLRFNNDQIFEILQQNESIDTSWTIDNVEVFFKELCDTEISPHNGSNCLNKLKKSSAHHAKKKAT